MANVTAEEKIMGKGLYGTPEMVKAFREHYIKEDGELPDFLETLELMKEKGALSTEELPVPELHGRMSKEDFMKAYDQVPFDAEKLMQIAKIKAKTKSQGAMFRNGKDAVCVQHIHDYGYHKQPMANFFAVTYMFAGKCGFYFGEEHLELKTGDLIIVTPQFEHRTHTYPGSFAFEALLDEATFNTVFNDFLASDSRLSDFFSNAVISGENNYCVIHGDEDDEELRFYLQSFAHETYGQEAYSNSNAVSLMKLFLGRAFAKYSSTMELYRDNYHKRKADAEAILRYITSHYLDATLEQTAKHFHYNKSYLSRYIQTHFHQSFTEIVTDLRIDHAREYLRNTDKHIMDIALLVGYDSTDHFSRMFRKVTGMSPAAYRKQARS